MALYLRYAVRSDLGLVRNNNEDSVYAGPRLLAIADGMGGTRPARWPARSSSARSSRSTRTAAWTT